MQARHGQRYLGYVNLYCMGPLCELPVSPGQWQTLQNLMQKAPQVPRVHGAEGYVPTWVAVVLNDSKRIIAVTDIVWFETHLRPEIPEKL